MSVRTQQNQILSGSESDDGSSLTTAHVVFDFGIFLLEVIQTAVFLTG